MKIEVSSTSYCISLGPEEEKLVTDDGTLYERLDCLPVYDIDYGHFGPNIFYTVNVEDDHEWLHEQAADICRRRLIEIQSSAT